MSDNPSPDNEAQLGSVGAEITYTYNPQPMQRFIEDSKRGERVLNQMVAAQERANIRIQQAMAAAQQRQQAVVPGGNAQTSAQQSIAQATRIQQAQIQADARLAAAQQQRVARVQSAELAASARVEAARIQSESRLRIAQERAARSSSQILPRSVADVTARGALGIAGAVGIATTVDQLAGALVNLARESDALAVRAESIGIAYEKTTKRAGIAADDLLAKLKDVAQGTITEANLQQNAVRAIQLNVGRNAQEIADLLALARVRARDFGITTEEAFDRIVLGIGKAEPELLDEIGILIDANRVYKEYADSIGVSSDALTKQQKVTAITNDLLRANKDAILASGDAELTAAEKRIQAQTRIQEAKTRFGTATAPISAGALEQTASAAELLTGGTQEALEDQNRALIRSAETYEEYTQRIAEANVEAVESASFLALLLSGLTQLGNPFQSNLPHVEALTEEQFNAARAAAAAAEKAEQEAAALRSVGDAAKQSTADLEALNQNQERLGDLAISSVGQLVEAEARRRDQLRELNESHEQRVAELNQQAERAAADTQDAITEAVREGAADRAEIEQDSAEAIADARREAAERAADAEADYQRSRTELITDYEEDRARLIAEQQERETERQQQQQRERIEAERDANLNILQGRSSFIQALFDLTRGRRGGGQDRIAALARDRGFQEQAAALVAETGDAQAGAAYLAELRRQDLERLQRQQDTAVQNRDARRGRPGFSQADAQAEQDAETAAINEANTAALEAIRAGAQDRSQQRADETQEIAENNQEALDNLKERHDEELANLRTNLDEQLATIRDNLKEQVADLRANTAERLQEHDAGQAKRIAQIEKHGAEQQAAITAQLGKEAGQYEEQQRRISDTYETLKTNILTKLKEAADQVDLLPAEARQQALADAYQALGERFGLAIVAGIAGAMEDAGPRPYIGPVPVPGFAGSPTAPATSATRTRARGSRVGVSTDPTLSDQAIDQVVMGGRQTDGFSSPRNGSLHGGVDIATPLNSPVRSPVDGTVVAIGSTREGGNYMIVRAANGDEWYLGHLNAATVEQGAQVRRGQVIARSGATGSFNGKPIGPHLHLQLRTGQNSRLADPTAALERLSGTSSTQQARSVTPTSTYGTRSQQTSVGSLQTQMPAGEPWRNLPLALPSQQIPLPAATSTTIGGPSITIDNRGAVYGTGVDMNEIERRQYSATRQALAEYDRSIDQQVTQLTTSGPRIIR